MPWNFVSCVSSSASDPVSTRCNPSAMVPRSRLLPALIASFGDGGLLVDIAQIPPFPPQRIERRHAIAATSRENALQHRVHVLRHRAGVAADVDRGAVPEPPQQFVPRIPQRVLHVPLLRLIARER